MREIRATVKLDKDKGLWATVDQVARAFALVATPFVVAFFGWRMEERLRNAATNQEYVKLAVSVLTQPFSADSMTTAAMRPWAVDMLQLNSPIKIPADAARELATGRTLLPRVGQEFPQVDGYCIARPAIAKLGEPVVFAAFGLGGDNDYRYTWVVEGKKDMCITKTCETTFDTPGPKTATVKITSNGQNIYQSAVVLVQKDEPAK